MNTDFLVGFMETANKKSISKASESLHITHTALAKQIRSLEKFFNVQLFIRSAIGVELTEAGKILYEEAHNILEQIQSLTKSMESFQQSEKIVIGTLPDIGSQLILKAISYMEKEKDKYQVIFEQSTQKVYELLHSNKIDMLIAESHDLHSSTWTKQLVLEPLYVIVRNEHRFSGFEKIGLEELSRENLVLYQEGCTIRARVTSLFKEMKLKLKLKTEVGFQQVILGHIIHSGGATILPKSSIIHLPLQLVAIPIHHPKANREIIIAGNNSLLSHNADRLKSQFIKAFSSIPKI